MSECCHATCCICYGDESTTIASIQREGRMEESGKHAREKEACREREA